MRGTKAVVWGMPNTLTVTGLTTFEPQSYQLSSEGDNATARDYEGDEILSVWHNRKRSFTIEVIPTGASIAAAKVANVIPDAGTLITIADSANPDFDSEIVTVFECVRASKSGSNTGNFSISIEMRKHVDKAVQATLT